MLLLLWNMSLSRLINMKVVLCNTERKTLITTKLSQETQETTVTNVNSRLEGSSLPKPPTLLYIGPVSLSGLSGGDISASQTRESPSCTSLTVTPLPSTLSHPCSPCLCWFPSTSCRWISTKVVSVTSIRLFARLLSHDTKTAHEEEEED